MYLRYNCEEDNVCHDDDRIKWIYFTWEDTKDDRYEKEFEMNYEDVSERRSMKWIKTLKKKAKWTEGKTLYIFTKTNADGVYYVNYTYSEDEFIKKYWADVIIEPDGYVKMKYFGQYKSEKHWVRPNCFHNDEVFRKVNDIK